MTFCLQDPDDLDVGEVDEEAFLPLQANAAAAASAAPKVVASAAPKVAAAAGKVLVQQRGVGQSPRAATQEEEKRGEEADPLQSSVNFDNALSKFTYDFWGNHRQAQLYPTKVRQSKAKKVPCPNCSKMLAPSSLSRHLKNMH